MDNRPVQRSASFDAVVIGGGPAGGACAALLAGAGWKVMLAEKSSSPKNKICGEFICPQAFEILDRIGALEQLEAEPHGEISGFVLAAPNGLRVETSFPRFHGKGGYRKSGISMRRARFDGLLMKNAEKKGAEIWQGARLVSMQVGDGAAALSFNIQGEEAPVQVTASLVIGADGRASMVARSAGLSLPSEGVHRGVVQGHFEGVTGMGDRGEMHILPGGAYIALDSMHGYQCNFSLVDDAVNLQACRGNEFKIVHEAIGKSPHLRKRFAGARLCGELRVLMPLRVSVLRTYAERVMLAGDAAGFFDPLTGEGIYQALLTGEMAAEVACEALTTGDCSARMLARYGRMHARWVRPKLILWKLFQGLIRREKLVNRFGGFLTRNPGMANLLIGFSGNYIHPSILLRPSIFVKVMRGLLPIIQ